MCLFALFLFKVLTDVFSSLALCSWIIYEHFHQYVLWESSCTKNTFLKFSAYFVLYTMYTKLVCYSEKGTIWCIDVGSTLVR